MSHPPRWLPAASRVASRLVAPLPANRYADPARSIPGSGKDPSRSALAPSTRGSEVHRTHRDSVQPLALSLPLPSFLSFGFMCIRVNQTSVLFSVAGCPPSCFCTDARDPSYNCFPSVFSPGQPGKRYLFSKSNTKTNILKEPFLARLSHTLLHFSPRCAESAWSCLWQQRGGQPLVGTLASPRHPPRQQYPL